MKHDVDELALVLLEAWSKAEPDHSITKHPHSYVATFADMALAAIQFMENKNNKVEDERPASCRNRLRDEGKPYPKSGCEVCKTGGLNGCPYEQN